MTESLCLAACSLDEIPSLQHLRLEKIYLSDNKLNSLDNLPIHLKYLDASYNKLYSDGILVPHPNLETLILTHNRIHLYNEDDLVMYYPSLKEINLTNNSVKEVGWARDTSLETLIVNENPIAVLCCLPVTLKKISAEACEIHMIQSRLPPSIESMFLAFNCLKFAGLPLSWSSTLRELHLDNNQIQRFPRNLPDSLCILTLNYNRIKELPSQLPASLTDLSICSNKLQYIPSYKKQFRILLLDDNCLITLPKESIAQVLSTRYNWNESIFHDYQRKIRQCWKRYVFTLRLRHYKRTNKTKEELFTVSMMPERWEQIDCLSSEWFRKNPTHNRIDHH